MSRIPALMKISSERNMVSRLKGDIKQLNFKLAQLQVLLEEKETQLHQLRSNSLSATEVIVGTNSSSNPLAGSGEPTVFGPASSCVSASPQAGEREPKRSDDIRTDDTQVSTSKISSYSCQNSGNEVQREEEFPEVRVDFQETFLGHTSPISRCRFSATGDNVASASVDGTVRLLAVVLRLWYVRRSLCVAVSCEEEGAGSCEEGAGSCILPDISAAAVRSIWELSSITGEHANPPLDPFRGIHQRGRSQLAWIWTYDSSAPASRNATIYCGAEIMSLEWECKSDRLLLIGTADGGIKAWNVDAKRVVCDLSCTEAFPSPVEPIFVSAAASRW
ncbi:hypothetical protein HAX54_000987 [Datura stramonium]|uniref:Uncharacterized protein n=1 Tax=Datura stramonium TaxID=4076 RepID=A0ABS8T2R6_DATST|nr:hypothetical protein [Datura stramonium]